MSWKRWVVGVTLAAFLAVAGGIAQAQDQPKQKQPGKQAPKVRPEKPVMTGTLLDAGIASLKLEGEAKTKVTEAVKVWKAKVDEEQSKLAAQRKELQDKIKAETDKDKKKALTDEMAKLPKGPADAEKYKSGRAALAGALTEEQLAAVDAAAKAALVDGGLKAFDSGLANMGKSGVELNDEQKTKVEAEKAKLKDSLDKIELGARNLAFGETMKSLAAVKKDVLTDEQRAKLAPAKKEPRKDDGAKNGTSKVEVAPVTD